MNDQYYFLFQIEPLNKYYDYHLGRYHLEKNQQIIKKLNDNLYNLKWDFDSCYFKLEKNQLFSNALKFGKEDLDREISIFFKKYQKNKKAVVTILSLNKKQAEDMLAQAEEEREEMLALFKKFYGPKNGPVED